MPTLFIQHDSVLPSSGNSSLSKIILSFICFIYWYTICLCSNRMQPYESRNRVFLVNAVTPEPRKFLAHNKHSPWSRKWQPTPVLLPGKFHGLRSLVGYSPWGRKESDMTERLHFTSVNTQWILVSFPNERIKVVPLALEYPTQISMVALDHMIILSQRKSLLRPLWWSQGREDPTCLRATKPVHHSHSAQCSQNNLIVF